MAWINYPPPAGTNVQDYNWITQVTKALDEVASAAGNLLHPPPTFIYDGNVIGALTATALTDTAKNWAINNAGSWVKRYVGWHPSDNDPTAQFQEASYDLVLLKLFDGGQWDWSQMLRIPINDQNWIDNDGGTFTSNQFIFAAIDTAAHPLAYFTHYFVISRGGLFVHERVPEWPTGWPASQTANDGAPINTWIRLSEGMNQSYYTRMGDAIGAKSYPGSITLNDVVNPLNPPKVVDLINPAPNLQWMWGTDVDLFNAALTQYAPIDHCFTADYHKTIRSWQSVLWQQCGSFIPFRSDFYSGYDRFYISRLTPPRLMWEAQQNAAKGTTGNLVRDGDGNVIGIEATLGFSSAIDADVLAAGPVPGRLTIERNHTPASEAGYTGPSELGDHDMGDLLVSDLATSWDGTTFTGPFDESCQNQDVWFTWGYDRYVPDRFRYYYSKETFMPDTNMAGTGAQIPPTEAAPGNWLTRPTSQHLIDYDDYGRIADPMSGTEHGATAPKVGTLARYVGDNWDDPTMQEAVTSPQPWQVEFEDKRYEGKSSIEHGSRNEDVTPIVITAVDDDLQFADESQNWWEGTLIGNAGESTHSGDVSTFTSTSITDSSHLYTPPGGSPQASPFWDGSTQGRWAGHWFMIWQPAVGAGEAGPLHQVMRPITAYDPATFNISFPEIDRLSASYESDGTQQTQYRIIEPKWEKNHFRGAICALTRASDRTVLTGNITYSANNRVRVDAWKDGGGATVGYIPAIGDTCQLKRVSTGTVWRWNGTGWEKPAGTDARAAIAFPDEQWKIPTTHRHRYGRLMNQDLIIPGFHQQIYAIRQQLRMRMFMGVTFTPDVDPLTLVNQNNGEWFYDPEDSSEDTSDFFSGVTSNPLVQFTYLSEVSENGKRSCGYPQFDLDRGIVGTFAPTSSMRQRIASEGHFLVYAAIPPYDADDGEVMSITIYEWDSGGDPVQMRKWASIGTFALGTAIHRTGPHFGSVSRPDPPTPPVYPVAIAQKGYQVRQAIAIVDYEPGMSFS